MIILDKAILFNKSFKVRKNFGVNNIILSIISCKPF